jgi:hypothetical protein
MTRGGSQPEEGKPRGDELLLTGSNDSHYKIEYTGGSSVSVALNVSDKDMDELYTVLRDNGFDRISATNGHSKHGPGTYVTVKSEQFEYVAHVNGKAHFDKKLEEKWKNVVSALKGYKKKEIEHKGVEIPAQFDPTEYGAGCPIQKEKEVE